MATCCKFLGAGILCSCNCPAKSGHKVPIIVISVLRFFVSVRMENCYTFKG